ncbi:MAG TPA: crosslink repair DNA glycosylase YcaQ family protein [Amycolatopsis sp.]|nr:crosslink repair DNA glycosylase YcaQ family protein [Amycolatopsis sp.]
MTTRRSAALKRLRAAAAFLPAPGALETAVAALGFVQYDPIRRPARAQDLILHQRVRGFLAGDLDRCYPSSKLEEDYFYTYGVLPSAYSELLHPRGGGSFEPSGLAAAVLGLLRERGRLTPQEAATTLGRASETNDWGGVSSATTRALEYLHYQGFARVSGRLNNRKVYAPRPPVAQSLEPAERLAELTLLMARLLAPVSAAGLRRALTQLRNNGGALPGNDRVVTDLLHRGALRRDVVEGMTYLTPADSVPGESRRQVRFLAPFDPVVWDRTRFEHLWGWQYRFEAYTPPKKRQFGYYALPLFWGDIAIGWVNLTVEGGALDVAAGFADTAPTGRAFQVAFDAEVTRMEAMLGLG